MDDHTELYRLIRKYSYREAEDQAKLFILSSGKSSRYYMDLKQTLLRSEGLSLVGRLLYQKLQEWGLLERMDAVGGMTLGADPIVYSLSLAAYSEGRSIHPLIVRKAEKQHGTHRRIEGPVEMDRNVLVVDDVVTTGNSVIMAVDALRESKCRILAVVAIVDREEGGRQAIESRSVDFYSLYTLAEFKSKKGDRPACKGQTRL